MKEVLILNRSSHSGANKALHLAIVLLVLLLSGFATAQTLSGVVMNLTTGKPAAGDEVVLLKLGQEMDDAGHTKTDGKGRFTFKLDDAKSAHLIRAIHQDVTYHRAVPPGATSVALEVYDVAEKIDGIKVIADIMRIEVAQGRMEVLREFGVQNLSVPPRTQMGEHNFEFYIPDGAQIIPDSSTATTEHGNPLKSEPVAQQEKNRFSFIFPLRPGLTRFGVAYQVPYSGSVNLDPKSVYPLEHLVVMFPKAIQFTSAAPAEFKLVNLPSEPDASVQVASDTTVGQNLSFKISSPVVQQSQQARSTQASNESRRSAGGAPSVNAQMQVAQPGGGSGSPVDAPDPPQNYRWWILIAIAAALVIAGVYVASKQRSRARALAAQTAAASRRIEIDANKAQQGLSADSIQPARSNSTLLEGIKEDLFQLEVERNEGQISQVEYDKAKSALDRTLLRVLKREERIA